MENSENSREMPWSDLKAAFGIDDEDGLWDWVGHSGTADGQLPDGWSLTETDSSGARKVAIFRVEGPLSEQDGMKVTELLQRFQMPAPAIGGGPTC